MDENCMTNERFYERNYTIDDFYKKLINEKPRKNSQNGWQIEEKCCIMDENLDLYNDKKFS